jgi:hypothetical protein
MKTAMASRYERCPDGLFADLDKVSKGMNGLISFHRNMLALPASAAKNVWTVGLL